VLNRLCFVFHTDPEDDAEQYPNITYRGQTQMPEIFREHILDGTLDNHKWAYMGIWMLWPAQGCEDDYTQPACVGAGGRNTHALAFTPAGARSILENPKICWFHVDDEELEINVPAAEKIVLGWNYGPEARGGDRGYMHQAREASWYTCDTYGMKRT